MSFDSFPHYINFNGKPVVSTLSDETLEKAYVGEIFGGSSVNILPGIKVTYDQIYHINVLFFSLFFQGSSKTMLMNVTGVGTFRVFDMVLENTPQNISASFEVQHSGNKL